MLVLLSITVNNSFAQELISPTSVDSSGTKVNIKNSDRFLYSTDSTGSYVQNLRGNVVIALDSSIFYCDEADIIGDTMFMARGSVSILERDSLQIFCNTLDYNIRTNLAVLKGKVFMDYGGQFLQTPELEYDSDQRIAVYRNGGSIKKNSATLSSQYCVYRINQGEAVFRNDVSVVDTSFVLYTDTLHYDLQDEKATFRGPTRSIQKDAQVYCEDGYYIVPERYALFSTNAQYVKDTVIATADQLYYDGNTGDFVMEGDAIYRSGSVNASAIKIVYNEKKRITHLTGFAKYEDDSKSLSADRIVYREDDESVITDGRSVLIQDKNWMIADGISYDSLSDAQLLEGNVIWKDTVENISLYSDKITVYKDELFKAMEHKVQPFLIKVSKGDTMYIVADTITNIMRSPNQDAKVDSISVRKVRDSSVVVTDSLKKSPKDTLQEFLGATTDTLERDKIIAYPNGKILSRQFQAIGDEIILSRKDSVVNLVENPVFWADSIQFSGEKIDFVFNEEGIQLVTIEENGLMVKKHQNFELFDQVRGKSFDLQFREDTLRRMDVKGNSESILFHKDEDDNYVGMDKSKATSIIFYFEDGELVRLNYNKETDAEFIPMRKTVKTESVFDTFHWLWNQKPDYKTYVMTFTNYLTE